MIRLRLALLGITLLLSLAGSSLAQVWAGPAGIAIEVTSKGKPVAGARVLLRYREAPKGSFAVLTDSKGRAAVVNLAPGAWNIEVSHVDYLSYVAAVTLEAGKKASETTSFLQATGTGRQAIRVKYSKASGPIGTPVEAPVMAPRAADPIPAPTPRVARPEPEPEPEPVELRTPDIPAPSTPPSGPETEPEPDETAPVELRTPDIPEPSAVADEAPDVEIEEPAPTAMPEVATPPTQGVDEPTAEPADPGMDAPMTPEPEAQQEAPAAEPTSSVTAEAVDEPAAEPMDEPVEPAAPAPEPEPLPAPTVPAPEPEPEPMPEAPAAPPMSSPEPEVAASLPPAAPPATPQPQIPEPAPEMPEIEAPEAPLVEEMPAPTVSEPAAVEPEPVPTPPSPAAEPEPDAAEPDPVPATPSAEATSAPTPAPRVPSPSLRTFSDRTCPECKPGEWSAASVEIAGTQGSGAACPGDARDLAQTAARRVARAPLGSLTGFAGPAIGGVSPTALELIPEAARNAVVEALAWSGESCRLLAVSIPRGAKFQGFRYEAADGNGQADCVGDKDCPIGDSTFLGNPGIERGQEVTVVYAVFENRSTDRERRARLTVYFVPASGWRP